MKINNLKKRENISFEEYELLVSVIFDMQTNTGEYTPHAYTYFRPAVICAFCLDGIELEEGESLFNESVMHEVISSPEVLELINFHDGKTMLLNYYDVPAYYYSAEEDAEKLVKDWKKNRQPVNQLVSTFNQAVEKIVALLDEVDSQQIEDLISSFIVEAKEKVEETKPVEEKKAEAKATTAPKRTRRKTAKENAEVFRAKI